LATGLSAQNAAELPLEQLRLRPMAELIEFALQNAPEIKARQIDAQKQQLACTVQRKSWMELITVNGSTMYGNYASINQLSTANNAEYILNDQRSFGLNVSLNMRISGADVFSRGHKNEIQRLQLDRIKTEEQTEVQRIRSAFLFQYQELEHALVMLRLKAEAVENHRLSLALAEKYFREGQYDPEKYSTVLSRTTDAEEDYQQAVSDCKRQTLLLQERCGQNIFQ
jgi:outer membrane protein TolC